MENKCHCNGQREGSSKLASRAFAYGGTKNDVNDHFKRSSISGGKCKAQSKYYHFEEANPRQRVGSRPNRRKHLQPMKRSYTRTRTKKEAYRVTINI